MANLDSRTVALAIDTLDQFYSDGGTLPIVFESSGNLNSWAVAAPNYFSYSTPKQQAAAAVEASLPPAPALGTTVPATLVPLFKSKDYNDTSGALQTGGWIDWDIIVPVSGTYVFTATTTSGGSYSLSIDNAVVLGTGSSGGTIAPSLALTPGVYSFQVAATSGSFTVSQVVVSEAVARHRPRLPAVRSAAPPRSPGHPSAGPRAISLVTPIPRASTPHSSNVGNVTGGSVSGLNPTAADYFAVYAYNAGLWSLPSADARRPPVDRSQACM